MLSLTMDSPIVQFFIGGTLIASITYLAKFVSPALASIITAFPIGMIPLFFLHNVTKERDFGIDTTITNTLVVMSYIFFDYILNINKNKTMIYYAPAITLLFWAVLATITFFAFF